MIGPDANGEVWRAVSMSAPDENGWMPIETAPREEFQYLLGFDAETARAHGLYGAGLCVICWMDADEDGEFDAGWQVQPFAEGLDCVMSDHHVTHWQTLPKPPVRK